ncbi:ER membrane protein complex subunit 6 [Citrus sinensis]|nr:ER membrane protein complex subunit 6 [Citrus sinensis]
MSTNQRRLNKNTTNNKNKDSSLINSQQQSIESISCSPISWVEDMATHSDSVAGKKSNDVSNDLQIFNAENLQSNMKVIYYSRTFLSIIGGVIAGILGFTGLMGFVFYFLIMAITSVCLMAKAKFSVHSYFDSWNRILLDGFLGGLMSFVLFWTYPSKNSKYLELG